MDGETVTGTFRTLDQSSRTAHGEANAAGGYEEVGDTTWTGTWEADSVYDASESQQFDSSGSFDDAGPTGTWISFGDSSHSASDTVERTLTGRGQGYTFDGTADRTASDSHTGDWTAGGDLTADGATGNYSVNLTATAHDGYHEDVTEVITGGHDSPQDPGLEDGGGSGDGSTMSSTGGGGSTGGGSTGGGSTGDGGEPDPFGVTYPVAGFTTTRIYSIDSTADTDLTYTDGGSFGTGGVSGSLQLTVQTDTWLSVDDYEETVSEGLSSGRHQVNTVDGDHTHTEHGYANPDYTDTTITDDRETTYFTSLYTWTPEDSDYSENTHTDSDSDERAVRRTYSEVASAVTAPS